MEKKKVCILTSVHNTFDLRVFHKQAQSLAKHYDVSLITCNGEGEKEVDGVKIISIPKPKSRLQRMFVRSNQVMAEGIKNNADIYHFHDSELILPCLILKMIRRKPIIYDIHEYNTYLVYSKAWIPEHLKKLYATLFDILEKTIAPNIFNAFIVPVPFMQDVFSKYHKNCVEIKNLPKLENFTKFEPNKTPEMAKTIVYIGGVNYDHGYKTMLESMPLVVNNCPDAKCNIVGPLVKEEQSKEFEDFQTECINKGNINLIGRLEYKEALSYLKNASIGWVPLSNTIHNQIAIPTKLFEYMAYSLPVVISDLDPVRDIIKKSKCGILVNPDDPKEHAEAINYLLSHPDEAIGMGIRGRQHFEELYNWNVEEKHLLDLYSQLLN